MSEQNGSEEEILKTDEKKAVDESVKDETAAQVGENKATSEKSAVDNEDSEQEELKLKVAELQKKCDDFEDKYLRAEAEMANMHTRFKKEQEKLLRYDGQSLAKDVLPVIDNLNRALQIEVTDDASKQLKRGIELVFNDMEKALKANNVTKIEALGQVFDPALHQAVKSVPAEKGQKNETVIEVFQDGYMLKDRVLRPAMVVVAQ
ncbi:nucleotide exchange factor GrpE [Liquorilactobacillus hordei]|uniref:Protein GrpE n=1 Tax=Liquorilactobacillus hordei DSM 19519 TaxID=1423759 RepID=A0A0R1MV95_9LACO|nr:nucleotide exchange factor GrpE [Liquorilactobacillus hordei]KRL08291.1 GrpE protein [Liquorilactobacillus hordei DSM 19519]QYH52510.1 nucleotide exchange factor GrpE [Liquorilactobacillus hordei DSM 19519]